MPRRPNTTAPTEPSDDRAADDRVEQQPQDVAPGRRVVPGPVHPLVVPGPLWSLEEVLVDLVQPVRPAGRKLGLGPVGLVDRDARPLAGQPPAQVGVPPHVLGGRRQQDDQPDGEQRQDHQHEGGVHGRHDGQPAEREQPPEIVRGATRTRAGPSRPSVPAAARAPPRPAVVRPHRDRRDEEARRPRRTGPPGCPTSRPGPHDGEGDARRPRARPARSRAAPPTTGLAIIQPMSRQVAGSPSDPLQIAGGARPVRVLVELALVQVTAVRLARAAGGGFRVYGSGTPPASRRARSVTRRICANGHGMRNNSAQPEAGHQAARRATASSTAETIAIPPRSERLAASRSCGPVSPARWPAPHWAQPGCS